MSLFKRRKRNDSPPWIKGRENGTLYNDKSDERYQRFLSTLLRYYSQWSIVDGVFTKTRNEIINKPNWREFI